MTAGSPVDRQLVAHLFAPTDGPDAVEAYRALHDLWTGCRYLFGMDQAIAATGLPDRLPPDLTGALTYTSGERECALAAQEHPDDVYQAVLRRHHDVLILSVALAPRAPRRPSARRLDDQWQALTVGRLSPFLGECRVRLVLLDAPVTTADADLARHLQPTLPPAPRDPAWPEHGVVVGGSAIWETSLREDPRSARELLIVADLADEHAASALTWSDGGTGIPPLARHLLHAAKLRYQLRVWRRDDPTPRLRAEIDAASVRLGPHAPDDPPAAARDVHALITDARIVLTELRELRRTVDIATDNMTRSLGETPPSGGLFEDDRALGHWVSASVDDDIAYLEAATDRAAHLVTEHADADRAASAIGLATRSAPDRPDPVDAASAPGAEPPDVSRTVFVVHGRDTRIRSGLFAFLRALDLHPLEWESLVEPTGSASPFLGEVVARGIAAAQAVVVLLMPEDIVRLHPSLHHPAADPGEAEVGMQARPNVLLELGMALAVAPARTLILRVGTHRPIADLEGRNFVSLDGSVECRRKLVQRLKVAGCRLDDSGQDWLSAGTLADPVAAIRNPNTPRAHGPLCTNPAHIRGWSA